MEDSPPPPTYGSNYGFINAADIVPEKKPKIMGIFARWL